MAIRRFPQLAHWGAFTAVVEEGKLVRCEPFKHDPHPSMMLASVAPMLYSDKRIRKPAVRRSWLAARENSDRDLRGRDDFVEIAWDRALDLIAQENRRVRDRFGAEGTFTGSYGWSSAGRVHHARSLVRRFHFAGGGAVDQAGNYSWGAAQFFLPHIIGSYSPLTGRVTSWPSIIAHCGLFIAFGGLALKNAQVSSGGAGEHSLQSWLEQLAAKGTPVINISPTRDDCPAFLKAEWIPIRPNTDTALMLALAWEILQQGAQDEVFLARYCVGWPQLAAYLRGERDGIAKTPHWASAITGIPAGRIRLLAQKLMAAPRSMMTCAYALQRAHRGEQPYWMVIALAAMLGQIGLPGGGFAFGHGSMNGVGNPRLYALAPSLPLGVNPAADLSIPVARIADMLLDPGGEYSFQGQQRRYPTVDMIYWAGGNPFHHHQQLNRLLAGWRKPATVVVQDIWWTPAAKLADIVLPVTTSLERNDIGGSSRDRYVLAMQQAVAPQHQARNDFAIFADLSERLGYREAFTGGRDERGWIETLYQQSAASHAAAGHRWPPFDQFWRQGYLEVPAPAEDFVFMAAFRRDPLRHPLQTPSSRIELFSQTIAGFAYADFWPLPEWRPPAEWLGDVRATRYPLHLITVQPHDRLHSQLDPAPLAQANKTVGRETLYLHPQDAARRGIADGEQVRVYNDRGRLLAGAKLSDGVTPGVIVMAPGAWFTPTWQEDGSPATEQAGNPNVLTLDIGTSPLTQGPNAMSCLVEVIRCPPTAAPVAG